MIQEVLSFIEEESEKIGEKKKLIKSLFVSNIYLIWNFMNSAASLAPILPSSKFLS